MKFIKKPKNILRNVQRQELKNSNKKSLTIQIDFGVKNIEMKINKYRITINKYMATDRLIQKFDPCYDNASKIVILMKILNDKL